MLAAARESAGGVGQITIEHLDLARHNNPDYRNRVAAMLRQKYAGQRFQFVAVEGQPAVELLTHELRDLFPDAILITLFVPKHGTLAKDPRKIIDIPWRVDPAGTVRAALDIFPNSKRLVVVTGANDGTLPFIDYARSDLAPWGKQLDIEFTDSMTYEDMLARISTLPPDSLVLYSPFFSDVSGRSFVPAEVAAKVGQLATAPVLGTMEVYLGRGIAGGVLLKTDSLGKEAIQRALDVLSGKMSLSGHITSSAPSTQLMFDWNALARWGAEPDRIPQGSVVLNQPATLWGQYRSVVIQVVGVFLVMFSSVVALVILNYRRKQAETALRVSEKRFSDFAQSASDWSWEMGPDLRFTFVSEHVNDALGASFEHALGKTRRELLNTDEVPDKWQSHLDDLEHRREFKDFEYDLPLRDGSTRHVSVSGKPIFDERGVFLGYRGVGRDITERKEAEALLHQAAVVFQCASEGIMITDTHGTILDVNSAFSAITGFDRDDVLGRNARVIQSGRQGKEFYAQMWRELKETGRWSGEIWNRRKNGEIYLELLTINTVFKEDGQPRMHVGLFHDITTLKEHQHQLERTAHFDALTQLPNRVLLADRLQQALNQTERRGLKMAVIFLDLDGFKKVNDQHGHAAGDVLLVDLSKRLKGVLREGDTLARIGGDEFVIVLIDLEEHASSIPILERLLQVAALPVDVDGHLLEVSASLGITYFPQSEDVSAEQLLRQADHAMYMAKQSGKNRFHIFDADQDRAVRSRHENVERIREALSNQEFVLHYQPQVNMRSGEVIGAEALIRWQHPEHGLLPPGTFLPLIEDHELIIQIGDWVLETALGQMDAWQASGLVLPVSVNIAGRQLQAMDFLGKLKLALQRHPEVATHLTLEVLESSALADVAQVSSLIEACKGLGIGFAIDDFGTGYSSLTYLKRLPAQTLKIDQSFVRDMLADPEDLAILDGVIGLAESFQRETIAEGVETAEHEQMLLRLGCDLGQGYAIAKPMAAQDIPAWVAAWRTRGRGVSRGQIERPYLPVLFAMTEHRAWFKSLESSIDDPRMMPPMVDHHQCRFGQWLDRSGMTILSAHPASDRIRAVHEQLHSQATELLKQRIIGGDTFDIQRRRLDMEELRDEFLAELEGLLDTAAPS